MRILHVITSLEIGGAPRLLEDLLPLQKKTEEISILVYERLHNEIESTLESFGIKIICLNEHYFRNPLVIFRMRKIFSNYDIVHAHLFPTIYWASCAARGLSIKLIYTEHSTTNSRRNKWYFRPVERYMYSRYNKIISISQETQEALTQWLGQYDSRFVVVSNGINIQKFSSLNVPVVPKSLIMVSRFATSKDQETVIRAMPEIDNEAILYFIGDGENKFHCEVLAKELGVSNRVYFLGSRSNVAELIASSYIGIQSSKWEGFGLTAVEIMACSKPIIATNVDGLKQVVEGAGEIFTLGSHSELAIIVNNLLRDKQYYQYIVDRCKERAKIYDISKTSEGYMKIYKTIL